MQENPEPRNTFILRIWREGEDDWKQNTWRGLVIHIRSGERRYLQSTEELIRFIERYTGKLDSAQETKLK